MNNEIDDFLSLFVCLKIRIDLVSLGIVSHGFIIALKILINGGTVVVKVGIRLLLQSLSLGVSL